MRSATTAVTRGGRDVMACWRMGLVFWFWNTAFALAVAGPVTALLVRDLGHSLYAREMLANFDLQWISEFVWQTRGWPAVMLAALAALAAAGYLLMSTFLAGGAITVFAQPERRYVPAQFYQGCGRNFARLVRLLLWSGLCYGVVFGLHAGLAALGRRLWGDSMEERPVVFYGWGRALLVVLLFLLVNMVFDYAKIRLVTEDSRKSLRAALASFRLVWRNPGLTAGAYALVTLSAVLLPAAYLVLTRWLPGDRGWWLLLVLLLQQAYMLARLGVRLLYFSSQTRLYLHLAGPPAEAAPLPVAPEPEPQAELEQSGTQEA